MSLWLQQPGSREPQVPGVPSLHGPCRRSFDPPQGLCPCPCRLPSGRPLPAVRYAGPSSLLARDAEWALVCGGNTILLGTRGLSASGWVSVTPGGSLPPPATHGPLQPWRGLSPPALPTSAPNTQAGRGQGGLCPGATGHVSREAFSLVTATATALFSGREGVPQAVCVAPALSS